MKKKKIFYKFFCKLCCAYDIGNYQARQQSEKYFGKQVDRIYLAKVFAFEVRSNNSLTDFFLQPTKVKQEWESQQYCIVNAAHGYWSNNKYITTEVDDPIEGNLILNELSKTFSKKSESRVLWIFGDSLQWYLYENLKNTPLCLEMYSCKNTYTWIYPLTNESINYFFDNKDFDENQFLNDIKNILLTDEMKNNNSVLLINFGLHVLRTLSMSHAKMLMDMFIEMIFDLRINNAINGFAKIIWKTTTPVYHNVKYLYEKRFVVNQVRVSIFILHTGRMILRCSQ